MERQALRKILLNSILLWTRSYERMQDPTGSQRKSYGIIINSRQMIWHDMGS